MTGITIIDPGLQTTLQAGPRKRWRHMGVPAGGAADGLSLALANHLVGNAPNACALEVTLSGLSLRLETDAIIAVTGGPCVIKHNGGSQLGHSAFVAYSGDKIELGPLTSGGRAYIAFSGGLRGDPWLDTPSTYLPARLGGLEGRVLRVGDEVEALSTAINIKQMKQNLLQTPDKFRPHIGRSWLLRSVKGPEFGLLGVDSQAEYFKQTYTVTNRLNRIGGELLPNHQPLDIQGAERMPSTAMFPGTVQCPPNGHPFLLMTDSGTTGGYPRITSVIRADRHLLGQIRPGDRVQFVQTDPDHAAEILRAKTAFFRAWLGDAFELW